MADTQSWFDFQTSANPVDQWFGDSSAGDRVRREAAIETARDTQPLDNSNVAREIASSLPFLGHIVGAGLDVGVNRAQARIDQGNGSDDDYRRVAEHVVRQQRDAAARQHSLGYQAATMGSGLAQFGAELLVPGAIMGRTAAAGAEAGIASYLGGGLAGRIGGAIAGQVVRGAATAATTQLPRVLEAATGHALPQYDVNGQVVQPGTNPLHPRNLALGYGEQVINLALAGGFTRPVLGGVSSLGTLLASSGIGIAEMRAADVLTGLYQNLFGEQSSYGTAGQLYRGEFGPAFATMAMELVGFTAMGLLHRAAQQQPQQQNTQQYGPPPPPNQQPGPQPNVPPGAPPQPTPGRGPQPTPQPGPQPGPTPGGPATWTPRVRAAFDDLAREASYTRGTRSQAENLARVVEQFVANGHANGVPVEHVVDLLMQTFPQEIQFGVPRLGRPVRTSAQPLRDAMQGFARAIYESLGQPAGQASGMPQATPGAPPPEPARPFTEAQVVEPGRLTGEAAPPVAPTAVEPARPIVPQEVAPPVREAAPAPPVAPPAPDIRSDDLPITGRAATESEFASGKLSEARIDAMMKKGEESIRDAGAGPGIFVDRANKGLQELAALGVGSDKWQEGVDRLHLQMLNQTQARFSTGVSQIVIAMAFRQHYEAWLAGKQAVATHIGPDTAVAKTEPPKPAKPLVERFHEAIDTHPTLAPEVRAKYKDEIGQTLSRMPEDALKRLSENIRAIEFHGSPKELLESLNKEHPDHAATVTEHIRVNGCYTLGTGKIRLDGGTTVLEDFAGRLRRASPRETYAHELGHAMDGDLSQSKEWQKAYDAEIANGQLSGYAASDAVKKKDAIYLTLGRPNSLSEGFAEFTRILYGTETPLAKIEAAFPKASAIFKENGLWPAKAPETKIAPDTTVAKPPKPAGPLTKIEQHVLDQRETTNHSHEFIGQMPSTVAILGHTVGRERIRQIEKEARSKQLGAFTESVAQQRKRDAAAAAAATAARGAVTAEGKDTAGDVRAVSSQRSIADLEQEDIRHLSPEDKKLHDEADRVLKSIKPEHVEVAQAQFPDLSQAVADAESRGLDAYQTITGANPGLLKAWGGQRLREIIDFHKEFLRAETANRPGQGVVQGDPGENGPGQPPSEEPGAARPGEAAEPRAVPSGGAGTPQPVATGTTPGATSVEAALDRTVGLYRRGAGNREGSIKLPTKAEIDALVEKAKMSLRNIKWFFQEAGGDSSPRTEGLSIKAAESINRFIASDVHAEELTPLMQKLVRGDATPLEKWRWGTAFQEWRHRTATKQREAEAVKLWNEANAARAASKLPGKSGWEIRRLMQEFRDKRAESVRLSKLARNHITLVGAANSPVVDEADYRAVVHDPRFLAAIKGGWFNNMVPFMEDNLRRTQGMAPGIRLDYLSQIHGMPMNALSIKNAADATPTTVGIPGGTGKTIKGGTPRAGNVRNIKQKKSPFANEATLAGPAYDTDLDALIENSIKKSLQIANKAEMYRTHVDEGLAVWGQPGRAPAGFEHELPTANPPPGTQAAEKGETSLWFKNKDNLHEVRRALQIDQPFTMGPLAKLLNTIQLMTLTDFAYHSRNQLTSYFRAGMSLVSVIKRIHGVIRLDAQTQKDLVSLAKINAMKPKHMVDKETFSLGPYSPFHLMTNIIDATDRAMRLASKDAYAALVKKKLAPDTEIGLANFVNQGLGQYNRLAQARIIQWFRDTGIGSFIVAGLNFNVQGVRKHLLSSGIKAPTAAAAWNLRARLLVRLASVLAGVHLLNYMLWGDPFGDDYTPYGDLKIGVDSNGKTMTIGIGGYIGLTRGMRLLGTQSVVEGMRGGASANQIVDRAVKQAAAGWAHPFFGPYPNFAVTAITGHDITGHQVAQRVSTAQSARGLGAAYGRGGPEPGSSQAWQNVLAAFQNLNGTLAAGMGWDRPREEWSATGAANRAVGPLGVQSHDRPPLGQPLPQKRRLR